MPKKAMIGLKARRDQSRRLEKMRLREQQLLADNRQLRMALDAANAGVWEVDVATQTVRVDARVKQMLGFDFPGGAIPLDQWQQLLSTRVTGGDYERSIPLRRPVSDLDEVIYLCYENRFIQYSSKPVFDQAGHVVKRIGMSRDVTERESLISQLQSAKDAFAVALESADAGYWEIPLAPNAQGQYEMHVEDNFARLFHMGDRRVVTTVEWSDYLAPILYPAQDYEDFHRLLRDFSPDVDRVVRHARLRFADGSETYVKNSAQIAYDPYGKPYKMIGLCVDITQRIKELEVAYALSETLLNSMRQMIYVAEIDTDEVLFINDVMLDAFGIKTDYHGKKYYDVIPQSNTESVQAAKKKLDRNPDQAVTWEIYQPYLKKELSCVARYIRWVDGHRVCFRTYFDISDIKGAQRAIKEQLRQQKLMADISRRFIQMDDVDALIASSLEEIGEFLHCYRVVIAQYDAQTQSLGNGYEWYNPALVQTPRPLFCCPLDPSRPSYQKIIVEKAPYFIADDVALYPHMIQDPTIKSILLAPYEVDGKFGGVLEFMSEEAGHVWPESVIQLATLCASTFSTFFSRQIIARSLVQARQAAESASKAKSAFLSNMSHEIRTPLNAIIGMTDLALKKAASPQVAKCLNKIQSASQVLLSLVNNVLDMSKIEAANVELAHDYFCLDPMLEKLYTLVSVRAQGKDQRVSFHVGADVPQGYMGDPLRLGQALSNILYNAIKFSGPGTHIAMEVGLNQLGPSAATLSFAVTDQGVGMTAEQLERVFRPFEQGDISSVRKFGGTGLGLTISKQIVELMGGEISVTSAPGAGSTFTLTVNLDLAPHAHHPLAPAPAHNPDFSGKRILLVEDVEINREIVKAMLEDTHVAIDEAENGLLGVEQFAAHPDRYDLIFMDIQMPELDGYAATRAIRARDARVPIIAMTANAFKEDVARSLAAGMNDHIIKPVDKRILMETAARYLQD